MTNEWTRVAPMSLYRRGYAHTVFSDQLYVIGGCDIRNRYLKTVECYAPSINEWQTLAPMLRRREEPSACASNGFIYVFGGRGMKGRHKSIERYDRRENS